MRTQENIPLGPLQRLLPPPPPSPPPDVVVTVNDDSVERIVGDLKLYESKFKTFNALGIAENDIFEKISSILLLDLNINIKRLFEIDYNSFKMVVAAFFGQKYALEEIKVEVPQERVANVPEGGSFPQVSQVAGNPANSQVNRPPISTLPSQSGPQYKETDFLPECHYPLHTVMVMCYAAHVMKNLFLKEGPGQELEQVKYEGLWKHFQDVACRIVNELYYYLPKEGPKLVRAILQADYDPDRAIRHYGKPRSDYLEKRFNQSKEVLAIAYKAEAMKFLSQTPCSNLVKIRYESKQVKDWRPKMKYKLWAHVIFRVIYICMFAYMLCRVPIYDDFRSSFRRSWEEAISINYVFAVLIAQLSMTTIKLFNYMDFHKSPKTSLRTLLIRYYKSNQLAIWRIILIWSVLGLEISRHFVALVGIGLKDQKQKDDESSPPDYFKGVLVLIPLLLELVYCSLFIITTISSLRFFYLFKSLGFFTHLIKKMLKTVGMFVLIFCVFWFVLAITHVSLSRAFMSSNNTFIYTISSQGKFEIFGEVQDVDRTGNITNCEHYTRTIHDLFSMDYKEASCLLRSSILPLFVFIYIFVAGVLLVNLLTAQLTKEYEKESENSRYYNGYLQYEQLSKIESKMYFPPPFSFIYIAIYIILRCFFCFPGSYQYLWEYTIEKMDGDPYQAVKSYAEKPGIVEKVKEILQKKVDDPWTKMKDLITEYENKESNMDNLVNAQMQMNELFVLEKREELAREALMSRREADSRMGYVDYRLTDSEEDISSNEP